MLWTRLAPRPFEPEGGMPGHRPIVAWEVAELHLQQLSDRIGTMQGGSPADRALRASARREIARYFDGDDDPTSRSRFRVIPLPWP